MGNKHAKPSHEDMTDIKATTNFDELEVTEWYSLG